MASVLTDGAGARRGMVQRGGAHFSAEPAGSGRSSAPPARAVGASAGLAIRRIGRSRAQSTARIDSSSGGGWRTQLRFGLWPAPVGGHLRPQLT